MPERTPPACTGSMCASAPPAGAAPPAPRAWPPPRADARHGLLQPALHLAVRQRAHVPAQHNQDLGLLDLPQETTTGVQQN